MSFLKQIKVTKLLPKFIKKVVVPKLPLKFKAVFGKLSPRRLKTKLVFFNLLTVIVIMAITITYILITFSSNSKEELSATLKGQTKAINITLNNEVGNISNITNNIAKDNALLIMMQLNIASQIETYFNSIKSRYEQIDNIVVLGNNGILYKTTDSFTDYISKSHAGAKAESGIILTEHLNIVSVQPIIDNNKNQLATILVAHDLVNDRSIISNTSKELNTNVILFQENKLVKMSDIDGKIYTSEGNKSYSLGNILSGKNEKFLGNTNKFFNKSYYLYCKTILDLSGKPVGIIAAAEKSSKLADNIMNILISMLVIGIIGIAIGFASVWIISSIITKPIKNLLSSVHIVQNGDLTIEVNCTGRDEIAELAEGFNNMVKDLRNMVSMIISKSNSLSEMNDSLSATISHISLDMKDINEQMLSVEINTTSNSSVVEEVTASMEEVTAGAHEVLSISNETLKKSTNAVNKANGTKEKINMARESSTKIIEDADDMSLALSSLESVSKKINNVVDAIAAIANSTNLLSLNAAIEAARAGEHGKGFSVVADEINKLSKMTKNQTEMVINLNNDIIKEIKNISNKMDNNTTAVKQSFTVVSDLGNEFSDFIDLLKEFDIDINKVVSHMEKQAASSNDVSHAMSNIAENTIATSNNISTVSEVVKGESSSIEDSLNKGQVLNQDFLELKALVSRFKVD